jgi:hypothetical protein
MIYYFIMAAKIRILSGLIMLIIVLLLHLKGGCNHPARAGMKE